MYALELADAMLFLSTLSLRRATWKRFPPMCIIRHFYPRSPCGERPLLCLIFPLSPLFLSTLSLRRATLRVLDGSKSSIISIHALLAESDFFPVINLLSRFISIHALLAESDIDVNNPVLAVTSISIHALLAESDG